MNSDSIERLFLDVLLKAVILGVFIILLSDLLIFPDDTVSITIDIIILGACIFGFFIRKRWHSLSVCLMTGIVLSAMFIQALFIPVNTTTSFSIIMLCGFIISVLLKGKYRWIMQSFSYGIILTIFIIQTLNPTLRFTPNVLEVITVIITYLIVYTMLISFSMVLKQKYDSMVEKITRVNEELQLKAREVEIRNEELLLIQDRMNELNRNLEATVNLRTNQIQQQNKMLINFSFANAHHLRGPVARLLGLLNLYKIDHNPDLDFYLNQIEVQVKEVDIVVRQIGSELADTIDVGDEG